MSFWGTFFGSGKEKIRRAITKGAIIIDVRSPYEFDQGHVPQSINIPLDRITLSLDRIRSFTKPIIFCCSNGSRSAQAVALLQQAGFENTLNAGNWESLWRTLRR